MKRTFLLLLIMGLAFSNGCTTTNTVNPKDTVASFNLIPNYDFENWNWSPAPEWFLNNWETTNSYPTEPASVEPDSSNAYHGRYAMKLSNFYFTAQARAETKFPINTHPLSLRAYVKCNLVPSDTVSIQIRLFYKGKETDSGVWYGTKSIDDYKEVNIPISQHSALADTALIEIKGGNHLMDNQPGKGSEFWVDYLSFLLKK